MGLLDNLYFGSSADFGGQQGGLLDFLRTSLDQNNKYQPNDAGLPPISPPATFADRFNAVPNAPQPFNLSGRSFDTAQFDPSTYAPNQAQPIAVGQNYQMPRIGSADQYAPQATGQAALPPNAQPTQGQLPPQNGTPPASPMQQPMQQSPQNGTPPAFLQPPNQGGFGGAFRGIAANAQAGPLGMLMGAIGGAAGMGRGNPQDIANQNMRAQYEATRQALIANGVPERQANSTAMLSVMNPEAAKTVLPELLTNKEKYGVISEDPLQGKKYGFVNEREQTVNGKPINAGASNGQSQELSGLTDRIASMRSAGATREQLLQQIPSGYREDVEALVTGKAVPANMGRAQIRGTLNILAHAVDKDYDEQMIPARVQMRKDFAGEGKNGQAIGAFNTVQHHAGQVSDAIDEFEKAGGGSDYPLLNAGKLMVANNTGMNPKLRDAAQKLQDKLNATEHEVAGAYNAGHITDSDRKTWNEIKASNLPANQLKQKLDDFVELLNGKRDSLNHMYQQTFHEDAPTIDKESNAAITAKIHSRLPGYAKDQTSGASSKPQTVIQNGHSYSLQPDGSYK